MSENIFMDKSVKPDNAMLEKAFGPAYKLWQDIRTSLEKDYGPLTEEWKHYGAKSGWTLKLMMKKRNLFFVGPRDKYFLVAFVFGDKAVAAVEQSALPKEMIDELKNATKYAEGRGLRFDVKTAKDVKHVKLLAGIKVEN